MSIIAINTRTTGLVGQTINPRRCTMITTDSLATITTAGYLNNQNLFGNTILPTDIFDVLYLFNEQTQVGVYGIFQVTYSATTGFTLNIWENPGNVLLPVVSGDFANFNGTSGQIRDLGFLPSDATKTRVVMAGSATQIGYIAHFIDITGTVDDTAGAIINAGTIQSGLPGTVGGFIAYPPTAGNGFLELLAINAGGAFNTIISNSAMTQTSTISIPNPGAATANFIISALTGAGVQHITSGSLQVDSGGLLSGLAAGGTNGSLTLYPTTTANGSFILSAVNAGGAFNTTISNGTMGQSSVFTLPDPANALSRFLVGATATPFVSGEFPVASGTGGLMVSSGVVAANLDRSLSSATASTNKVFVKTITATAAALATSGHVAVMAAPSGTSQFKILDIRVMYAAAGLSGGGGDRLITLTDGTIVFNQAGITAALLGTPIYTLWGGTGNPIPGSVSTESTAGAAIYLVYSGGAADYTTGQIVIEVELAQITV